MRKWTRRRHVDEVVGWPSRAPIEGRYVGIREQGQLIAMAGERLQTSSVSEISAVCVRDTARRKGLASALTLHLVDLIDADGRTPVLHVRAGNEPAHAAYQAIGFEARAPIEFTAWRFDPTDG